MPVSIGGDVALVPALPLRLVLDDSTVSSPLVLLVALALSRSRGFFDELTHFDTFCAHDRRL